MLKKLLALLLVCFITVISVPVNVFSMAFGDTASDSDRSSDSIEDDSEYIYYSDLFYGYDVSYLKSAQIMTYAKDTYEIPLDILIDYCNSPGCILTGGYTAITMSPKEMVGLFSELYGTDYTYNKALDAANVKMLEEFFDLESSDKFGIAKTILKRSKMLTDLTKEYRELKYPQHSFDGMSDGEIFETIMEDIGQNDLIIKIDNTKFNEVVSAIATDVNKYMKLISFTADVIDLVEYVYTAMIMESVKLETVEYIRNAATSGSDLYNGMDRLKKQLADGLTDNILSYYFRDKVVEKLSDALMKLAMDYASNGLGFVYAVSQVFSEVLLGMIANIPNLHELMLQSVLTSYSGELYNIVFGEDDGIYSHSFNDRFTHDEVWVYEYLFNMYIASTNACLDATKKLTLSSNEVRFEECVDSFGNYDFEKYILDIKENISNIPADQRIYKHFSPWVIEFDEYIVPASDTIEEGKVYMCRGAFQGDISVSSYRSFTVPKGDSVKINGDVKARYYGNVVVDGELEIAGDFELDYNETFREWSALTMTEESSVLRLGGNFISDKEKNCESITKGTIVFNGTKQQTVKCQRAYNIEVLNPEGILYAADLHLYGKYDLHRNPLSVSGFRTQLHEGGYFVEGSDYQKVSINSETVITLDYTLNAELGNSGTLIIDDAGRIDGNVTNNGTLRLTSTGNGVKVNGTIKNSGTIEVPLGCSAEINGNVNAEYGSVVVHGELEISGDLDLKYHSVFGSCGKLIMTEESSVIRLSGNFRADKEKNCESITAGTIVFNGTKQQTVNCQRAYNIEVLNPEGIALTAQLHLYGHYDAHNNTVSGSVYCHNGASFGKETDYGYVYIPNGETVTVDYSLKADVTNYGTLIIAEGGRIEGYFKNSGTVILTDTKNSVAIEGNMINSGTIEVPTGCSAEIKGNVNAEYGSVVVHGELEISGDLDLKYHSVFGSCGKLIMTEESSVIRLGGNFRADKEKNCESITEGKIIFNGTLSQTVWGLVAKTVILENKSDNGVTLISVSVNKLFDHMGNKFSYSGCSFTDYDGDGINDHLDPEPAVGPNTVPELSVDNYVVILTAASNIKDLRYAPGVYTTTTEIRNAEGNVAIDNSLVKKYTVDGNFVYEMPKGGYYTLWVRMNDGRNYILPLDVTHFTPYVSAYGVKVTVHNLYDVKDFYIAKGEYSTYREIKDNGYIVSITGVKIGNKHDYTYTVYEPGVHTVLIRYNDGSTKLFHETLTVDEPVFTTNGLQVTVSNLPDVKVIRTAYGKWNTVKELKATDTIRNFSAKTAIKGKDPYTIQYREEGIVTVIVEYNNGYQKVFHYEVTKKTPTVEQDGNKVVFSDLDGLVMVRYAKGVYTTSTQIKNAKGSKALKPANIVDGKIEVTLDTGTYTFCVQYDDESFNYYVITVE